MPLTHTEVFVRTGLIIETLQNHRALIKSVEARGVSRDVLKQGVKIHRRTIQHTKRMMDHSEDHTIIHQVHRSIQEIDAWFDATLYAFRKAWQTKDPERSWPAHWSATSGQDIELLLEEFEKPIQVLRIITAMRTRPKFWAQLQKYRPRLSDDLQRANVVMRKTFLLVDKRFTYLRPTEDELKDIETLNQLREHSEAWLRSFSERLMQQPLDRVSDMGLLGLVPEGMGPDHVVPFGGTAYEVLRHAKAVTKDAITDTTPAPDCPGWGTGTRLNRENYWDQTPSS